MGAPLALYRIAFVTASQTLQIPLGGEDVVFEVLQAVIDVDGGGDHAEGGGHHKTEPKPALPAGDAPPGDGGVAGGKNQAGDHAIPHLIEIKEDREETEEEDEQKDAEHRDLENADLDGTKPKNPQNFLGIDHQQDRRGALDFDQEDQTLPQRGQHFSLGLDDFVEGRLAENVLDKVFTPVGEGGLELEQKNGHARNDGEEAQIDDLIVHRRSVEEARDLETLR